MSMLEIRGHKPLLTEGTLRASPPEEKIKTALKI